MIFVEAAEDNLCTVAADMPIHVVDMSVDVDCTGSGTVPEGIANRIPADVDMIGKKVRNMVGCTFDFAGTGDLHIPVHGLPDLRKDCRHAAEPCNCPDIGRGQLAQWVLMFR